MATKKTTTTSSTSTPTVLTHATAADLLNVGNSLTEIAVPEISEGAVVYLKPLTAGVMLDFSSLAADQQSTGIISLVANSLCDADGTALFSNDDTGHNLIRRLPVKLFNRLSQLIVQSIGADVVKND